MKKSFILLINSRIPNRRHVWTLKRNSIKDISESQHIKLSDACCKYIYHTRVVSSLLHFCPSLPSLVIYYTKYSTLLLFCWCLERFNSNEMKSSILASQSPSSKNSIHKGNKHVFTSFLDCFKYFLI